MLENNSVRRLQYESDLRIAQQYGEQNQHSELENEDPDANEQYGSIVFEQPKPVVTSVSNLNTYPQNGLDFLHGIPSIHIEQTFELHDYNVSSENRFNVRNNKNETLLYASETSTSFNRMCWGSSRPFSMNLIDRSNKVALTFNRKLPIGIFCMPECLEIWAPPGDLLGCVRELNTFYNPIYIIENSNQDTVFQIHGPQRCTSMRNQKEFHLKILSSDGIRQYGEISRIWCNNMLTYTQNVYFNDSNMNIKLKSLFLGAAFLMEYIYFQSKYCC